MHLFHEKKNKAVKIVLSGLLAIFFVSIGFFGGIYLVGKKEVVRNLAKEEAIYVGKVLGKYNYEQDNKNLLSQDVNFKLFWQVWNTLKKEYVDKDKIDEKKLFYGSLKGLVASVGDPYTVFMDPKMAQEFADDLSGAFEGIGTEIGIRNDILTVIAPLPDTPAEKAGLRPMDKIYAIDNVSTAGITIEEAVNKIRGQKGTTVTLTISRDGLGKAQDIKITRNTIVVKSVKSEMKDDGIFVLKISSFNNDTKDLFNDEVVKILEKNPKGIILDLRSNPGGYLETAVDVASEWIEHDVIVTEKFSDTEKNDFQSTGIARLKNYKTVVLVNEGSASASEIVAGALKDFGKAIIIGKKTFGKGSVQTVDRLEDGSSIKITVAKWLTPKGTYINEHGIEPDVQVELSPEDSNAGKDPQMEKAVNVLLGVDKK